MSQAEKPFNSPFAAVGKDLRELLVKEEKSAQKDKQIDVIEEGQESPTESPEPQPEDEESLFEREMDGVDPLGSANVANIRSSPRPVQPARDEETEVVAELDDLVAGKSPFELSWSEEHIEGIAKGVDRRLLRKLRKGEYSLRAHLDLHGETRKEAKPLVEKFLFESRYRGHRCVLIVHGRGLNSKDRIPVLKESLRLWLTRGRIGRLVLAFCTANPTDGGLGAVYVLLRK
ncbi:MAG: Smr/MutS family protein [Pseudomonadota bacterium]